MKVTIRNQEIIEHIFSSDNPVTEVQSLSHRDLIHIVEQYGIEESGWAIACATKEQVNAIVDDLLWKYSEAEQFETLSYDQFFELLESLYETDKKAFSENLTKFDEDLIVDILSHELLIFDLENFILDMNSIETSMSKELLEKALSSHFQLELDQYLILSRDIIHWDIIANLLSHLSQENHSLLDRLLERIAYITSEYVDESDGLHDVLNAREQIIDDNYGEREVRRLENGHVTAPMAKSFFTQLQRSSLDEIIAQSDLGIIEKQYFKYQNPTQTPAPNRKGIVEASPLSAQELVFLLNLSLEYERFLQSEKTKQEVIKEVSFLIKEGQSYLNSTSEIIKAFKVGLKLQQKKELT